MRGRGVVAACGLGLIAAVAVLAGCAAPDAAAPQQPVPSSSAEEQAPAEEQASAERPAAELGPEPHVTNTLANATTVAATATTVELEASPTTALAAATTTIELEISPTTTLAAGVTAAEHEASSTSLAATTGDHETAVTTTLVPVTATTTAAAVTAEDQGDPAEPDSISNADDPDAQAIDAADPAVPAVDVGLPAAEEASSPAGEKESSPAVGEESSPVEVEPSSGVEVEPSPAVEKEPSPAGGEAAEAAVPASEVTPYQQALAAARRLAPDFVVPNDCRPPPLDSPYSMPNAPRAYRSGVHAGVDFLCSTPGHPVVSVLDGQVVVALGAYQDPTLQEWDRILGAANALGYTPPYTLAMLSGRYVVVDHGIIDGLGHVVSLYAHLDAVDPGIGVGMAVDAGQRLGGIGNTGTRAGVLGDRHGQLHLHWNFYVDGQYLGAGLSESETRDVYAALFEHATGTGAEPEPGAAAASTGRRDQEGAPSSRPGPAGPGTLTPSGHKPLDQPIPLERALDAATWLSGDVVVPSDCQSVPLRRPSALPNAPRRYRSGIHQGVDFGCSTRGHPVVAALAGRVVMAVGDFEDPTPQQRDRLLDTAAALGATPAYTLVMLYGNHVAVDHGVIDGVGHVMTLYAHLDGLEAGIRPGLRVEAGQRLGTIGNTGTGAGASGSPRGLHLHWELHLDGH